MGRGEVVRADFSAPARTLFFPFLELLLITALCWMAVGFMDQPGSVWDVNLRNGLVGLWAVLSFWRFGLPVIRARRRRFIVTNQRVIARAGSLRPRVDSIPFHQIHSVRRRRGGISIAVYGYDRPVFFENVPRARRVEQLIGRSLRRVPVRH